MNFLGVHLRMFIGERVPTRPPRRINEALQSVEVTHVDEGRSGFQLTFQIGRGLSDVRDYALVKNNLLQPFNRVIIIVIFNARPHVLMDGIITDHQLSPGNDPGASTFTLTGRDISVMMDLEQVRREAGPQQYHGSGLQVVNRILGSGRYSQYGLHLNGEDAHFNPPEETTTQPPGTTDLGFIESLAKRCGYVFYIEPGESRGTNIAYWGPPNRRGERQPPLSANMGPNTNIESISFRYDGMAPKKLKSSTTGEIISSMDGEPIVRNIAAVRCLEYDRFPIGSSEDEADRLARALVQGRVNKSFYKAVTATGELDAMKYGRLLKPRRLVSLRGVGWSYDGTYYVQKVTHKIDVRKGEYKQSFTLTREGHGSLDWRV